MKVIDNRYKLDKYLEDGQNSSLYLATDLWNYNKTHKLRFYNMENQEDIVNYFINEFIFISKVRHKNLLASEKFNIAKYVDGEKLNLNWYYSVMEYIDSPTLEDVINNLSFEEKVLIVIQILIIIDYLHFKGIVYRYLSPTNIFVTEDFSVKLKDLATIYEKAFDKNYDNIDSYFIAPEILLDTKSIDKRVDYYSISRLLKYIFEDDFYNNIRCSFTLCNKYKVKREKINFLEGLYKSLLKNSQVEDGIDLHEIIIEMINLFNIDYDYDIVMERNNLNFKTKIIGRQDEIKEVLDVDNQLDKGIYDLKLILVEGEEGLGKTRLLKEINHLLTFKGRTVYYLPVDEKDNSDLKFICGLLRKTIKDTHKNLLDKYKGELKKIVPELNNPGQITSSINLFEYKEKYRLYHRIKNYIEDLSKTNPIYIIIDDIHNIDEWSIGVINYLINNSEDHPILFIGSFDRKVVEKEDFKYEILRTWDISDKVKNIKLSNLGIKDIGEVVQHILGMSEKPLNFSTVLLNESLGNPNYIELIIKNLFATEQVYINKNGYWCMNADDYNELNYSTSFDEVLKNQMNTLSKDQKEVIQIISVFKFPVTKDILLEMLNIDIQELDDIIDKLVIMNLLEERLGDWGYSYTVHSPNLKRIISSNIPDDEKNRLHSKVAEIYRANSSYNNMNAIEELTHHLSMSDQVKEAVDYLITEANKMQSILDMQALHIWHLAHDLIETNGTDYRSLEINENIGKHYIYSGDYKEALSIYKKVLKEAKKYQKEEYIVRANNAIGEIYFYKNKQDIARKCALKGKKHAKEIKYVDGILDSMVLICRIEVSKGNLMIVRKIVKEAIEIANKEDKEDYLGILYNLLGLASYYSGNIDEAKEKYKQSIEAFYISESTLEITKPMNNIANIYSDHYREIDKAMEYYNEGLNICTKYGYLEVKKFFLYNIGEVYLRKHDFENAKKYIKSAKQLSIELDDNILEMMANISLGQIYLTKGDYEKAYNSYIEIIDDSENKYLQDIEVTGSYYNYLGEFNFKFGQLEKALEYTKKAIISCKDFKIDDYLDAKARLILIKYFNKGDYDIRAIENVLKEYMNRSIYEGLRIKYLQFAAVSFLDGNIEYGEELLKRDEFVKDKFSSEYIEFAKGLLVINLEKNKITPKRLRVIEEQFKDNNFPILQLYSNIILGSKFYKDRCYFKSLNYYLETLDSLYRLISKIPDRELQISFIKNNNGDLIKDKIGIIMNNILSKEIEFLYLSDLKEDEDIEKYFEISEIFKLISDEELEKITDINYLGFNKFKEINCIEKLIENFTDDYEWNLYLILKYLSMETYAQNGYILILDKNTGEYTPIVSLKEKSYNKTANDSILKAARRNKKGIIIKNSFKNIEDNIFRKLLPSHTKAIICVPIIRPEGNREGLKLDRRKVNQNEKRIIGYIYLETNKIFNRFDEKRLKLINTISYLVFMNIENSKLKTISTVDKMTSTFTRKYFDLLIKEFMELAVDNNNSFGLLMIDIDKFKNINDTYGHRKGDEILKKIGTVLRENIRSTDIIGRYGGEEFIIVLKGTNNKEARIIAEKLRQKVEELNISNGEAKLTVSIGLAMYPSHGQFKEELIEKADQALYCAKEQGRNKVITWHPNIASTINRVDRLAGIVSGNMAKDQRRVLAMLDMVELIKSKETKDNKIYEFLGRLIEVLDSEYGILIKTNENNSIERIYARQRFKTNWIKASEVNINMGIIDRIIEEKKGEFLIDWETFNNVDVLSGTPNWQSIIGTPLLFEDEIKGVVYLSVPMKEKEFDYNCYNLVNVLCGIFSSVV